MNDIYGVGGAKKSPGFLVPGFVLIDEKEGESTEREGKDACAGLPLFYSAYFFSSLIHNT